MELAEEAARVELGKYVVFEFVEENTIVLVFDEADIGALEFTL